MSEEVRRERFLIDVCYQTKDGKPLSNEELTMMAKRGGTYFRVAAAEGLEERIEVLLDSDHIHQTAHHHDARWDRCESCRAASLDELGNED